MDTEWGGGSWFVSRARGRGAAPWLPAVSSLALKASSPQRQPDVLFGKRPGAAWSVVQWIRERPGLDKQQRVRTGSGWMPWFERIVEGFAWSFRDEPGERCV